MNRRSFLTSSTAATAVEVSGANTARAAEGRFQPGSVTYKLLQDMELETCITTLEKAGFAAIELRTGHKHGVEPSLDAAARVKVSARFARSKASDDAVHRQQIEIGKTFADLAKATGVIAVKVRPNGLPAAVPVATTVKNIASGQHEPGDYSQSKGVEVRMDYKNVGACWNSDPTDVVDGSVKQACAASGSFVTATSMSS
jgi:hypothetical protein